MGSNDSSQAYTTPDPCSSVASVTSGLRDGQFDRHTFASRAHRAWASPAASGPRSGGPAHSISTDSASVNNRDRVRNRAPSGASSESPAPRPGTTSIVSRVCCQYLNCASQGQCTPNDLCGRRRRTTHARDADTPDRVSPNRPTYRLKAYAARPARRRATPMHRRRSAHAGCDARTTGPTRARSRHGP